MAGLLNSPSNHLDLLREGEKHILGSPLALLIKRPLSFFIEMEFTQFTFTHFSIRP